MRCQITVLQNAYLYCTLLEQHPIRLLVADETSAAAVIAPKHLTASPSKVEQRSAAGKPDERLDQRLAESLYSLLTSAKLHHDQADGAFAIRGWHSGIPVKQFV